MSHSDKSRDMNAKVLATHCEKFTLQWFVTQCISLIQQKFAGNVSWIKCPQLRQHECTKNSRSMAFNLVSLPSGGREPFVKGSRVDILSTQ